ncbi:MAG: hypothetical protein KC636_18470 [Myxococcales bacterium]|nr:hypothetical protein [Myxococcales bacterium]
MKIVKFLMIAFGLLGAILGFSMDILSLEGGAIVVCASLLPALLGLLGTFVWKGIPRWAAGVSILAFMVVGMKTTEEPFQDIMLAAFAGMLLAIALTIKPDKG